LPNRIAHALEDVLEADGAARRAAAEFIARLPDGACRTERAVQ
jgi:1-deoxy-D-xylulose-5-phosphate reductoisomerase